MRERAAPLDDHRAARHQQRRPRRIGRRGHEHFAAIDDGCRSGGQPRDPGEDADAGPQPLDLATGHGLRTRDGRWSADEQRREACLGLVPLDPPSAAVECGSRERPVAGEAAPDLGHPEQLHLGWLAEAPTSNKAFPELEMDTPHLAAEAQDGGLDALVPRQLIRGLGHQPKDAALSYSPSETWRRPVGRLLQRLHQRRDAGVLHVLGAGRGGGWECEVIPRRAGKHDRRRGAGWRVSVAGIAALVASVRARSAGT